MCEILGFSCQEKKEITEYLKIFYSHSENHPHGWGFADIDNKVIEKEEKRADDSQKLKGVLHKSVRTSGCLAHIRYATIGNVVYENAHPFCGQDKSGRNWVLIHNGTIFDGGFMNKYLPLQEGDTDSERILLYIIDRMNDEIDKKGRSLDAKERFYVIERIINRLSRNNKLNVLIHDGDLLYAHCNLRHSLYYKKAKDEVLISTLPLDQGAWEEVPFLTLLGFIEGEERFRGVAHNNEYIPKPEDIQITYQMYAGL